MMKFFRKYNKQLLAVFMVALMVVFVGGSALQGLLTPETNRTVGNSKYGPMTEHDQQAALRQTELLQALNIGWNRPLGGSHKALEITDWILLAREAKALGADAEPAAVRTSRADADLDDQVADLSHRLRVKSDSIYQALAAFRGLRQAAIAVAGASAPSEAELSVAARDALETVSLRAIVLPAEAFVDSAQTFTPQEINDHFAAHRNTERGEGLNFGYFRQPSVKMQYIKIDGAVVREQVGVANLERKAKAFFEEHRKTDPAFRKPGAPPPDPAVTGAIEGPPAPPFDPFLNWDEAKAKAVELQRKQSADEAAEKLASWITQNAAEAFVEVPRGEDGYRPMPGDVARLEYFDEMIQRLPPSLSFPGAVSVKVTDMFTLEEADNVAELGSAEIRPERGRSVPLSTLVSRSPAFTPKVPNDDGVNPADYLAVFQTAAFPLKDASGNLYVVRIAEARAGHPPESVDEVREDVIADLRLLRAFEAAKKRAELLRSGLGAETIKEVAEGDPDLTTFKERGGESACGFYEPAPFARVTRNQAAVGRKPIGVYAGLGLELLPNEVVDACFALEHEHDKSKVFDLPGRAAVLLVEVVAVKPAAEDEFNQLRKQLVTQLAQVRMNSAVNDWLDPAQVRARAEFAFVTR